MINSKVHISNSYVKKQFEELDNNNIGQRFYYGIISDTRPNSKSSPLAVNVQKNIFYINVNQIVSPSQEDCLFIITSYNGILEKRKYHSGEGWSYFEYAEDTAASISSFLNTFDKISSYVNGTQVVVNTFDNKIVVSSYSPNKNLVILSKVKLLLNKGSVVFKDGNSLTLEENTPFDLNILSNYEDGDMLRVILRYKLLDTEIGYDLFGDEQVKRVDFDSLSNSIVIENANNKELEDNEICVAILRLENNLVNVIDNSGHNFKYDRPWFSPKDVEHRSFKGTSLSTINNPHGIGYNDIDSNNTLHNRLMDNGIIVSIPTHVQDCSGELIRETLYARNVVIDEKDTFNLYPNKDKFPKYHRMSFCPNQILGIYDKNGYEIYCKHISNTPYLLVENAEDIEVVYLATKTAYSSIEYSQGIKIDNVSESDVLFSEGKSLSSIIEDVNIFHRNINGYYVISVSKNGSVQSNPMPHINNSLDMDSDNLSDLYSTSRLKVYLYNTDCKFSLNCPSSGTKFESLNNYNINKTNASYTRSYDYVSNTFKSPKIYKESFTSPYTNNYISIPDNVDYDENGMEYKKYLKIYLSDSNENSCKKEVFKIENFGNLITDKTYKVDLKNYNKKLVRVKAIIEAVNVQNPVSVGFTEISKNKILEPGAVSYISLDTNIDLNFPISTFSINFGSDAEAFITKLEIELDYDIIDNRYFITQEEEDKNIVTRLLYDPYKEYNQEEVIKINSVIYIKRECFEYGYKEDDTEFSISSSFPIVTDLKTNNGFNVEVSIYGESNGNAITETLVFDDYFREQEPFNYKLTNNSFDSISKYTINNKTTQGNILILSYPISNYSNPCNISTLQFKDNAITKYQDSRICIPKLEDSFVSREDLECISMSSEIVDILDYED